MTDADDEPRDVRLRKDRSPRGRREDPAFAGVVIGFARAVRRMLFGPPPDDEGLAGSRIPRRPPDASGSGSVALAAPAATETSDEEPGGER
jgi:hypothetical protein